MTKCLLFWKKVAEFDLDIFHIGKADSP